MDKWDCSCSNCDFNEECERDVRMVEHSLQVSELISRSSDIVTLVVGAEKTKLHCHKLILSYYSKFFEAAFLGQFSEASGTIEMLEDNRYEIDLFLRWAYSGHVCIQSGCLEISPEKLWVLGDRLMSASFQRDVMYVIFDKFTSHQLEAADAKYVYDHTQESSLLRRFIKEIIRTEGPLRRTDHPAVDEWWDLIRNGGELVLDQVKDDGFAFKGALRLQTPYSQEQRVLYLPEVVQKDPGDWFEDLCHRLDAMNPDAEPKI